MTVLLDLAFPSQKHYRPGVFPAAAIRLSVERVAVDPHLDLGEKTFLPDLGRSFVWSLARLTMATGDTVVRCKSARLFTVLSRFSAAGFLHDSQPFLHQ